MSHHDRAWILGGEDGDAVVLHPSAQAQGPAAGDGIGVGEPGSSIHPDRSPTGACCGTAPLNATSGLLFGWGCQV